MTLDLSQLYKPQASISTSVGHLFLYGLRTSDFDALGDTATGLAVDRVRAFLPSIASLTEAKGRTDERPPLLSEVVNALSDAEVEQIAEIYIDANKLSSFHSAVKKISRKPDESATDFLVRLLQHRVEEYKALTRQTHEKFLSLTDGVFDSIQKSSSHLGSTLRSYEELTRKRPVFRPYEESVRNIDVIAKQHQRLARDRAEELDMTRLTAKMTAESARTLKDLAEVAANLLSDLDAREKKADESTRKSLKVAVISVVVSAVLSLFALIVAGMSYLQDRANVKNEDAWQSHVISEIRKENAHDVAGNQEIGRHGEVKDQLEVENRGARSIVAQALPNEKKDSSAPVLKPR